MNVMRDAEQRHKIQTETQSRKGSMGLSSATGSPRSLEYHVRMARDASPVISPMGTLREPPSSVLGHCRLESSSSLYSGSLMSGPRKADKMMKEGKAMEENSLLKEEEYHYERSRCRQFYFCVFILAFVAIFFLADLSLWVASRFQEPKITMHSIVFERYSIGMGIDESFVPTMMATVNSTVKFAYHSAGFGFHVTSTPLDLRYLQLTLASGKMEGFYQSRNSKRDLSVATTGNEVPVHGAGQSLKNINASVPLTLGFCLRSSVHLVGALVKSNFHTNVQCTAVLDQRKLNTTISLENSCIIERRE